MYAGYQELAGSPIIKAMSIIRLRVATLAMQYISTPGIGVVSIPIKLFKMPGIQMLNLLQTLHPLPLQRQTGLHRDMAHLVRDQPVPLAETVLVQI
ncbi:hypothetical protein D3C73_733460 [compost metagenome]